MSIAPAPEPQPAPIVVLWTESSGYLLACLEALSLASGRKVVLVCFPTSAEAPFEVDSTPGVERVDAKNEALWRPVAASAAGLLVCGWHIRSFRRAARTSAASAQSVLFFDNQWRGGARQRLGRAMSRWLLLPAYTACFLPGDRQAEFARHLGFGSRPIRLGAYSADVDHFASAARLTVGNLPDRRQFVFVGRANNVKGLETLADAYSAYRSSTAEPWGLLLVGQGHDASELAGRPGVTCRTFVQPSDLPGILEQATCFVMPSRFEPWGVALHEAAASGLALLASTAVGAGDAFVRPGENGWLFEPGDAASLASHLTRVSTMPAAELEQAASISRKLSMDITPRRWAETLLDLLKLQVSPSSEPTRP